MLLFLRAIPEATLHPITYKEATKQILSLQAMVSRFRNEGSTKHNPHAEVEPLYSSSDDYVNAVCTDKENAVDVINSNKRKLNQPDQEYDSGTTKTNGAFSDGRSEIPIFVSPRAMTCREFMINHAIGVRRWWLGQSGDF